MQADKSEWVRKPAEVHSLINAIKAFDFFAGDLPQFQLIEHIAASSYRNTEILMLICALVRFFQVFRFGKKLFSQPLRRCLQIR